MAKELQKTAKELALELFEQGKRPADPEVKGLGLKPKTTYNYFQAWKRQNPTPPEDSKGSKGSTSQGQKVLGKAIEVGKITITPENWAMTQYGAILILDTYNKAKRDIEYGGTIGEFICHMCELYRRLLDYKEVEDGREASSGNGGTEQSDEEDIRQVSEVAG